jgi:hypothetical protein
MSRCDVEKLKGIIFNGVPGWRHYCCRWFAGAMDGIRVKEFSDIWL